MEMIPPYVEPVYEEPEVELEPDKVETLDQSISFPNAKPDLKPQPIKNEIDDLPTLDYELDKEGVPKIKYTKGVALTEEEYFTWLKKEFNANPSSLNGKKYAYNQTRLGKMEFGNGSRGIIMRGKTAVREAPFLWQQNVETKHSWAVFVTGDFYGFNPPQWKKFKSYRILIPFDKSEWSCIYTTGGYLAKFDEASISQFPIHNYITSSQLANRVEDTQFASEYITLMTMLEKYTKAKWNWKLIVIIIGFCALAAVGVWYWISHPQFLQGLSHSLGLGHL